MTQIETLIQTAGPALIQTPPEVPQFMQDSQNPRMQELLQLLQLKNGFFAFKSALHVFPAYAPPEGLMSLVEWNQPDLWRQGYGEMARDCLFFAQDLFGVQFCIYQEEIYSFDPETGDKEKMGATLEDWATEILKDPNLTTGFSLAKKWIQAQDYMKPNERLVPIQAFVLGGAFDLDNLQAQDAVQAMRSRAQLALQIQQVEDDQDIQIHLEI